MYKYVTVTLNYCPSIDNGFITANIGDRLILHHIYNDGWCDVEVEKSKKRGFFPMSCVVFDDEDKNKLITMLINRLMALNCKVYKIREIISLPDETFPNKM